MKSLKIIILLCLLSSFFSTKMVAQKYFTKTSTISFFSKTPVEDIEATSNTATSVFDSETGKMQWAVLIKSFEFEKALMQEHFNENYMESSQFPKAQFKGSITSTDQINLKVDGTYYAEVSGNLTIHGVTKSINAPVTFKVSNGNVQADCALKLLVADYGIEIPSIVKNNIAKEIEIEIKANYEILGNS